MKKGGYLESASLLISELFTESYNLSVFWINIYLWYFDILSNFEVKQNIYFYFKLLSMIITTGVRSLNIAFKKMILDISVVSY